MATRWQDIEVSANGEFLRGIPHKRFIVVLNGNAGAFLNGIIRSFDSMSMASDYAMRVNQELERHHEYTLRAVVCDDAN